MSEASWHRSPPDSGDNRPTLGAGSLAVVGMSCRFPGARNTAEFWNNLCEGRESIAFFSPEELEEIGLDPDVVSNPDYVRAKGVLQEVQQFDASFFGYSPREAEAVDPQHRFFLECAWEALEDAGYNPQRYQGAVGVYAGASFNTYLLLNLMANPEVAALLGNYQITIGNDKDHLATRVSYKLNLRGPSITVQTTCSTSLVAVCLASQSLLDFQCDMALAGGVSITLPEKAGYFYQQGGIASPDGHCRVFDAEAKGTVGGNGVGVVVLKRLEDALRDADNIHAIIRGVALNNDGAAKVGYTAPSVEGQAEVIAMAQAMAQVDPETITYIEAHGTGTALGDPIEVAALTQVFRRKTAKKQFCGIGSVKSNIGHLDAAAGVAGLIKTVLALSKGMLPSSLHFKTPNPQIDFANSPFYVCQRIEPWPRGTTPRRAGVSSFGIGGTNAHVVLEEPPRIEESPSSRSLSILTLSAQTAGALDEMSDRLTVFLREHTDRKIADVAYTLQIGRRAWPHRRAIVCSSTEEAVAALTTTRGREVSRTKSESEKASVIFMFPGQGSQYPNMARGIYQAEATFRRSIDRCAELLSPQLGIDLRTIIFRDDAQSPSDAVQLDQTWLAQPALFAIEYALATLWISWGIRPAGMIGHSIGEYVAACLGGVFELEEALTLVALRGRLMQALPEGAMLAVELSEREVAPLLTSGLSLAAINAPRLCVLSGDRRRVEACRCELVAQGVGAQLLRTSHAFHSEEMEPAVGPFSDAVTRVALRPSRIPYMSNVTGTWITGADVTDPGYWAKHLRRTVRFSEGLERLLGDTGNVFLEVGPGNTLTSLARQQAKPPGNDVLIASCRNRHDSRADAAALVSAVSKLWSAGVDLDWNKFNGDERRRRVALPTYPFDRKRYWVAPSQPDGVQGPAPGLAARRRPVTRWLYSSTWRRMPVPHPSAEKASFRGSTCLLFEDRVGLANRCEKRLKDRGWEVVTVATDHEFRRLSASAYKIRPNEPEDYRALVSDLRGPAKDLRSVVHCWSVEQPDKLRSTPERLRTSQALSFASLIFLTQALGEEGIRGPVAMSIISTDLHDVLGGEPISPEKALLLGPCRVIPQEYAQITCQSIDLSSQDGWLWDDKLVDELVTDCEHGSNLFDVAYRRGYRWLRTIEPISLLPDADYQRALPLRNEGVYLITGGLGGIGFAVAEYLAETFKAKLVLVGRSIDPDAASSGLGNAQPSIRAIGDKLTQLKTLGGDVLVVKADVSSRAEMLEAASRVQKRFGRIHGVIHAAGIPGEGIIQLKKWADIERVFSPKIDGTLVLADVFDAAELDFVLLFSSLASILGGPGQVDYSAANAFLDAFAHEASRKSARVLSINWDRWAEVGMAANEFRRSRQNERGEGHARWLANGIRTHDGIEALSLALTIATPQIAISRQDLGLLTSQGRPKPAAMNSGLGVPAGDRHPRPDEMGEYVAPTDDTQLQIARQFEALLGIERVSIEDDFFELGGHSLSGTQLTARLRELFSVELPVDLLFKAPTIRALADAISAMRDGRVPPSGEGAFGADSGASRPSIRDDGVDQLPPSIPINPRL